MFRYRVVYHTSALPAPLLLKIPTTTATTHTRVTLFRSVTTPGPERLSGRCRRENPHVRFLRTSTPRGRLHDRLQRYRSAFEAVRRPRVRHAPPSSSTGWGARRGDHGEDQVRAYDTSCRNDWLSPQTRLRSPRTKQWKNRGLVVERSRRACGGDLGHNMEGGFEIHCSEGSSRAVFAGRGEAYG